MLVNSAFFQNQSIATVFPLWPAPLSFDLDRNNSQISLNSTVFFLFFFRSFQKLAIRKNKYSRNTIFSARKNKFAQKLIRLRYAVFLSEYAMFHSAFSSRIVLCLAE